MTQIANIDFDLKRLYLHSDTVISGFDIIATHFETKQRFAGNSNNEQSRKPFLSAEGYIPKGSGKFTPRYGYISSGWRIIPYDGLSHVLKVLVEIVSEDQIPLSDVFDRSGIAVAVSTDPAYNQNEIIEVNTGSGMSTGQDAKLTEMNAWVDLMYKRMDLNTAKPNNYADDGSIIANPDFTLTKTDNGNGTFKVQRS